ncbi:hypothetical protein, partial [Actinoplanes cyaneus]
HHSQCPSRQVFSPACRAGNTAPGTVPTLHSDLENNCRYAYGRFNPVRSACLGTADKYYLAVIAFGDDDA